jgi:hypothetical protein
VLCCVGIGAVLLYDENAVADYDEGIKWLTLAGISGHTISQLLLSCVYTSKKIDFIEAVK